MKTSIVSPARALVREQKPSIISERRLCERTKVSCQSVVPGRLFSRVIGLDSGATGTARNVAEPRAAAIPAAAPVLNSSRRVKRGALSREGRWAGMSGVV
jgi:hypothetical protein